jgi:hypothetical protein
VGYSDNDNFFRKFPHDDIVREALEEEPFDSSGARRAGQVGERNDFVFEKINRGVDCVVEFLAKSRTLMLVPGRCFDRFYRGLFKDSYPAH